MSAYLKFVVKTVDTLVDEQSARLAGRSAKDAPLCLTTSGPLNHAYTSLGSRRGESFVLLPVPEIRPQARATIIDLESLPVLDKLHALTCEGRYRELVGGMLDVFAMYGFDSQSGLGYLGLEAGLDAWRLGPIPLAGKPYPRYKPGFGLPLELLWARTPEKLARMIRASFYGLVTCPDSMDFNRYCEYGWRDDREAPLLPFNPGHRAFASTASYLIRDWVFLFSKVGDPECLVWAQTMADKWKGLQHPDTGLMPYFCGSLTEHETAMTPQPFARDDLGLTAVVLLQASKAARERPEGAALADQLMEMGLNMIAGLAKHAYDPGRRLFPYMLNVDDGSAYTEAYVYVFSSQEQKDTWVGIDPALEAVDVYAGAGFYESAPSSWGTPSATPMSIAMAAELTGDASLRERAEHFSNEIMREAASLKGPVNRKGQWTYDATGSYVQVMLSLYRLTGNGMYLSRARQLADMELEFLSQTPPEEPPEWWRMPFRNEFLKALLDLTEAVGEDELSSRCRAPQPTRPRLSEQAQ